MFCRHHDLEAVIRGEEGGEMFLVPIVCFSSVYILHTLLCYVVTVTVSITVSLIIVVVVHEFENFKFLGYVRYEALPKYYTWFSQ